MLVKSWDEKILYNQYGNILFELVIFENFHKNHNSCGKFLEIFEKFSSEDIIPFITIFK